MTVSLLFASTKQFVIEHTELLVHKNIAPYKVLPVGIVSPCIVADFVKVDGSTDVNKFAVPPAGTDTVEGNVSCICTGTGVSLLVANALQLDQVPP